jgi:hypothetical protein
LGGAHVQPRPHRGEESQRLIQARQAGGLRPRLDTCRRRHRDQRAAVDGARRHDAQFQDHHGDRRECRHTDEDHNASLCAFYLTFGDIMSTDMLITCLERNARGNLAAAE